MKFKIPVHRGKLVGDLPLDFINNVKVSNNRRRIIRFIFKEPRVLKSIYGISLTIKICQN